LQNRSFLTLAEECQEHDLAVWKLERIMMRGRVVFVDLPEDCGPVIYHFVAPSQQASWYIRNLVGKR
jgi:hypothetical protein